MGAYNIVGSTTLVGGQPEDVGQVLANLQAIQTVLNGGLDDSNIAGGAAILLSKLAGYPTDNTKFARGDGTWAVPSTVPPADTVTKAILKQTGATSPLQGKRVESGKVTVAGGGGLATITFANAFGAAPVVILTADSTDTVDDRTFANLQSATTTNVIALGFIAGVGYAPDGTVINWMAVGT